MTVFATKEFARLASKSRLSADRRLQAAAFSNEELRTAQGVGERIEVVTDDKEQEG
jgi:hypothetical protein